MPVKLDLILMNSVNLIKDLSCLMENRGMDCKAEKSRINEVSSDIGDKGSDKGSVAGCDKGSNRFLEMNAVWNHNHCTCMHD